MITVRSVRGAHPLVRHAGDEVRREWAHGIGPHGCAIKAPGVEDGKSAVRPLRRRGMAMACRYQAGYNLTRVMNIVGVKPLGRDAGLRPPSWRDQISPCR
jgi:hypothetical protein